ncbi:MAG: hypothetical protein LBK53_06850 [Heliobacteriaceae bacterium]|nr:hypothetical protein [Heliobacteriaceae bacterium]
MIPTAAGTQNETNGNGQFGSLLRKKNNKNDNIFDTEKIDYINKPDRRMRFNNSQDPIYYVFDVIENRPLKTLAKEFVKDSFFEIANFVTEIVR